MTELKPCPFCGGAAALVPRAVNIVLQKDPSDPKFGVSVICGKCGSESANYLSEEYAGTAWNRRDRPMPATDDMRTEFMAWVRDRGCDTDGAWSAWQGCWNFFVGTKETP